MIKFIFIFSLLATLLLGTGCAEVRSRDCWFEYSNPIDYSEVLRTLADPLVDLWFLPYSPCLFDSKAGQARDRD